MSKQAVGLLLLTVGTTKFPALTEIFLKQRDEWLGAFKCVVMQVGVEKMSFNPQRLDFSATAASEMTGLYVTDYLINFEEWIEAASFVITHAGSGTVMQLLRKRKAFVSVANLRLSDRHQSELVDWLKKNAFALCLDSDDLKTVNLYDLYTKRNQFLTKCEEAESTKQKEIDKLNAVILPFLGKMS